MTKAERIFDVVRYIGNNAGVGAGKLHAVFSDLSERGMFRYLKTLREVGVVTRSERRYTLEDYWASLFQNIEAREALEALVSAGMEACEDEEVLQKARELTKHLS